MGLYDALVRSSNADPTIPEKDKLYPFYKEILLEMGRIERETLEQLRKSRSEMLKAKIELETSIMEARLDSQKLGQMDRNDAVKVAADIQNNIRNNYTKLMGSYNRHVDGIISEAREAGRGNDSMFWTHLLGTKDKPGALYADDPLLDDILTQAVDQTMGAGGDPLTVITDDYQRNRWALLQDKRQRAKEAKQGIFRGFETAMLEADTAAQSGDMEGFQASVENLENISKTIPSLPGADDQTLQEEVGEYLEGSPSYNQLKARADEMQNQLGKDPQYEERLRAVLSTEKFQQWAKDNGFSIGYVNPETGEYVAGGQDYVALMAAQAQMRQKRPARFGRENTGEYVRLTLSNPDMVEWEAEYAMEGDTPTQTVYNYTRDPETDERVYLTPEQAAALAGSTGQSGPLYENEADPMMDTLKGPPVFQTAESLGGKNLTVYGKRIRMHATDPSGSIRVLTPDGEKLYTADQILNQEITGKKSQTTILDAIDRGLGRRAGAKAEALDEEPGETFIPNVADKMFTGERELTPGRPELDAARERRKTEALRQPLDIARQDRLAGESMEMDQMLAAVSLKERQETIRRFRELRPEAFNIAPAALPAYLKENPEAGAIYDEVQEAVQLEYQPERENVRLYKAGADIGSRYEHPGGELRKALLDARETRRTRQLENRDITERMPPAPGKDELESLATYPERPQPGPETSDEEGLRQEQSRAGEIARRVAASRQKVKGARRGAELEQPGPTVRGGVGAEGMAAQPPLSTQAELSQVPEQTHKVRQGVPTTTPSGDPLYEATPESFPSPERGSAGQVMPVEEGMEMEDVAPVSQLSPEEEQRRKRAAQARAMLNGVYGVA